MNELNDKLVDLLREYDLSDSIWALSFQLLAATTLAARATKFDDNFLMVLAEAEKKSFWINDTLKKILAKN